MLIQQGVGKSSLLSRFVDNSSHNPTTTIGIDFKVKTIESNNQRIKLQIWDLQGNLLRYGGNLQPLYRNVKGIILVCDVTFKKSFDNIKKWVLQFQQNASQDTQLIIIGNKMDWPQEYIPNKNTHLNRMAVLGYIRIYAIHEYLS